jgi:hypothetical protein
MAIFQVGAGSIMRNNPRKLIPLLLAALLVMAVAWMARRTLKRETGNYAAIMTGLAELAGLIAASNAGTAKSRATESRLNALVPRIPVPQFQPGTTASGVGPMGSTNVAYNPQNSVNEGGNNSSTSGQVGSASPHTHSMTHMHSSSSDLEAVVSNLASDHSQLVADHNNLKAALAGTGVLH